jgi:hypothetical protein
MTTWTRSFLYAVAAIAALMPVTIAGQNTPPPSAIARTADGKPNLQGIWQAINTADWDLQVDSAQKGVPAGVGVVEGNEIPYQPWALAKRKENFEKRLTADPNRKCDLPGVPRATYMPFPFHILQTPDYVVFAHEYVHATRIIYTNGSKHPPGHIDWWLGDSRGSWDGDTFVIDSIDFNDETWFDKAGDFHSDALHVVERLSLIDRDHLNYEVTIEDPKVFTKPWKISMPLYRRIERNAEVLEYEWTECESD